MEFDAGVMLDRIGVGPGWRCLDLGCGPGGIMHLLSSRVGPTGRVVGLDADPVMLEAARAWVAGPAARERGAGRGRRLPDRASALTPSTSSTSATSPGPPGGGTISSRRPSASPGPVAWSPSRSPTPTPSSCHPPHPAWERLKIAVQAAFASVGADTRLAKRLYRLFRAAGLEDVRYRPFLVGVTSGEPMADFLPATVESIRATLIDREIISRGRAGRRPRGLPPPPGRPGHRVHELPDRPGLGAEGSQVRPETPDAPRAEALDDGRALCGKEAATDPSLKGA